ncbi:serine hydrolase domain-containing protein [Actinokineospora soli]|uniref:Serine hydrolase domain-containing protein n=1 Tax=Actinokineospora soli TaxID=1048753 RepID=A0ABW2TIH8_9PSEU
MDELRAWLDERAEQHLFSGVVLVHRGGEPVFSHAAGLAHRGHGVPVRADTRFAVASVTKLVTATAALQLVERGALGLHAPLVDVLPAEHRPVALTREHTLHHLLSHTSGLTNYHDDDDETGASFIACWDRIPTYHVRKPADMLPLFADLPAHSPPGARFSYGDANYILIGLVIEAVTGRSYHDVVAAEVLAPAGMADAGFDALDTDPVRLATGYQVADGPYETWLSNVFSITATGMPDGGMICAAPDLVRLIDALRGEAHRAGRLRRHDHAARRGRTRLLVRLRHAARRRRRRRHRHRAQRRRPRRGRRRRAPPRRGHHRRRPQQPGPRVLARVPPGARRVGAPRSPVTFPSVV